MTGNFQPRGRLTVTKLFLSPDGKASGASIAQSLDGETASPHPHGHQYPRTGRRLPTHNTRWRVASLCALSADYVDGTPIDLLRVSISGGPPRRIMKTPVYDTPRCSRAPAAPCVI